MRKALLPFVYEGGRAFSYVRQGRLELVLKATLEAGLENQKPGGRWHVQHNLSGDFLAGSHASAGGELLCVRNARIRRDTGKGAIEGGAVGCNVLEVETAQGELRYAD